MTPTATLSSSATFAAGSTIRSTCSLVIAQAAEVSTSSTVIDFIAAPNYHFCHAPARAAATAAGEPADADRRDEQSRATASRRTVPDQARRLDRTGNRREQG